MLGYLLLFTLALSYLSPMISTLLAAFRTDADLLKNGIFSWPQPLHIGGFADVWKDGNLGKYVRNSLIVTLTATLAALVGASLAAYALARYSFRLHSLVLLVFLAGMFFPPQVYIVPIYFLANKLRVYNTYIGLIAVHLAYQLPFSILLLRGFFKTIPTALLDAAHIDGAGELKILLKIIMPLSVPSLGAMAILLFTWIWNDYFWALSMSHSLKAQTIMIGIAAFRGRLAMSWNSEATSSLIAMLPPLIMFFVFQKFFIKGIRMGGIK
jgi:ABC-type glycerol-3-phosphate transport system permease component